jgi:NAD dependent epimerase/dehydratase family enzyme
MARVLPLARLGLAGPLGSGRQYWSWITLQDEVRALAWAIDQPSLSGTVNLTGPQPLPQLEVIKAVASALGRPALLPAPSLALKVYLGEFSSDILGSLRVTPSVLTASGFTFEQDTVEAAAQWLVGQA